MKIAILLLQLTCISFILNAQDCKSVYHFEATDKTTFSTSCGTTTESGWKVSKNSCNFYTPLTNIDEEGEGRWIHITAEFNGSSNLDARDFVWIFYYVNGNAAKTSTINGEIDQTSYKFRDSLLIPPGGSYRFRIAMVCDEADEYWLLGTEKLSICITASEGEQVVGQVPSTEKISIYKERDIAKLQWFAEPGDSPNYFKIERSLNGEKFEFAGFVKEQKPVDQTTMYSFIDAGVYRPQTWYKITKVNLDGKEIPVGDIVSIRF